jgi:ankyrin repeat protein/nucleoside phosphorylase
MPRTLRCLDYKIGWICALPIELAAAEEMLDEPHDVPPYNNVHDTNLYTCGRVGQHNVVIACLPKGQTGTNSAAAVAVQMRSTFSSVEFGLMVGVGGGVPSSEVDVRLGDVVVSNPDKTYGGVVQYDFGKATPSRFQRTGSLNAPPAILLHAVTKLQSKNFRGKSKLLEYLYKDGSLPAFAREATGPDTLYKADYDHEGGATCGNCNMDRAIIRTERKEVTVHYGTIASGNQVIRNAAERDKVSLELGGVLCFEMEAAGLMNNFPCLVVRGICDYADSHKNKQWQPYAAGTAAAYAKELLSAIPPAADPVNSSNLIQPALKTTESRQGNGAKLVRSLDFPQMGERFQSIRSPYPGTCEWLLTNTKYLTWLNDRQFEQHHGLLWLKGKPGSGKSTLVKFIFGHAREQKLADIHVSFFFNARGSDTEKSTEGMYRHLLFRLLTDLPETQQVLDNVSIDEIPREPNFVWHINFLERVLMAAIVRLKQRRLWIYIDALDEGNEYQVRDMVAFFTSCLEMPGIKLRVFFASRRYPRIGAQKSLGLDMDHEDEHLRDIGRYVQKKSEFGNDQLSQDIQKDIVDRSSGVFMWVILVIRKLNKEYDRGCPVSKLKETMSHIPGDLGKFFQEILDQSNGDDGPSTQLCLQWLLYSERPLDREELYFAIQAGKDGDAVMPLWNRHDVPTEIMDAFILNSSKGLAELTQNATVQFIHETIREYLFGDGAKYVQDTAEGPFVGLVHDNLTRCCADYISATQRIISEDPEGSFEFPFIGYALEWELNHANASEAGGVSQASFLQNFNVQQWISLNKYLQIGWFGTESPRGNLEFDDLDKRFRAYINRIRPSYFEFDDPDIDLLACIDRRSPHSYLGFDDSYIGLPASMNRRRPHNYIGSDDLDIRSRACIDRRSPHNYLGYHDSGLNLLYIVTEKELPSLIRTVLRLGLCTDIDGEFNTSPLRLALKRWRYDIVAALLAPSYAVDGDAISPDQFELELDRLMYDYNYGLANFERASVTEVICRTGQELSLLTLLRSERCEPTKKIRTSPLAFATERGYAQLLKLFLARDKVDPNSKDISGFTTLSRATQAGRGHFVKLILQRKDVDIDAQCSNGQTALSHAAKEGHDDVLKLLCGSDADVNVRDEKGLTPLMYAAKAGHECIVRCLVAHERTNISSQSDSGFTALTYAVLNGHESVVEQLLPKMGTGVNLKGATHGLTPLVLALKEKYWRIACLILDHPDVDIRICDKHGRKALSYASDKVALESQYVLAGESQARGHMQEAIELLESVVKVQIEVLPPDDAARLASQHELAMAYRANGQVREAVDRLGPVVELERGSLRDEHAVWLESAEQALADMQAELAVESDSDGFVFSDQDSDDFFLE